MSRFCEVLGMHLCIPVLAICLCIQSSCEESIKDLQLRQANSGLLLMSGRFQLPEMLGEFDFPMQFIDGHHPQDYELLINPIEPEYIVHRMQINRLILRVSWKVENQSIWLVLMSFFLEPRLPSTFYLSGTAYRILSKNGRIRYVDEDLSETCSVNRAPDNMKMGVFLSPEGFEHVNFMGMNALTRFGLIFGDPKDGFSFRHNISWF